MFDVSLFFRCIFLLRCCTYLSALTDVFGTLTSSTLSLSLSMINCPISVNHKSSRIISNQPSPIYPSFLDLFLFFFFIIKRTLYSLFQVILNVTFYFVLFLMRSGSLPSDFFSFSLFFLPSSRSPFYTLHFLCHHLPFFFLSLFVEVCPGFAFCLTYSLFLIFDIIISLLSLFFNSCVFHYFLSFFTFSFLIPVFLIIFTLSLFFLFLVPVYFITFSLLLVYFFFHFLFFFSYFPFF